MRNIQGELHKKLLNKALSPHKKDIDSILREYPDGIVPTGIKKNGKEVTDYYYNVYTWVSEDEYNAWREWATREIEKEHYPIESLNWWECLHGLREDYLPFRKREGELF